MAVFRQRGLGSRLRLRLKVVLAVYVAALALMPLSHHDLACHFKSTTHCTTCVVSGSGETAADASALITTALVDAGQPPVNPLSVLDLVTHRSTTGRSPPARG